MAVTYVTADEVQAATRNTALAAESDSAVDALIEEAEIYIDAAAKYWTKYSDSQSRTFPRVQDVNDDGTTFIPETIKQATIAQVEFLYNQTPDVEHGIKEDEAPKPETLSPRARMLMSRGYIKRTGSIVWGDDGGDQTPETI